jgi:hypothetical protein
VSVTAKELAHVGLRPIATEPPRADANECPQLVQWLSNFAA